MTLRERTAATPCVSTLRMERPTLPNEGTTFTAITCWVEDLDELVEEDVGRVGRLIGWRWRPELNGQPIGIRDASVYHIHDEDGTPGDGDESGIVHDEVLHGCPFENAGDVCPTREIYLPGWPVLVRHTLSCVITVKKDGPNLIGINRLTAATVLKGR